MARLGQKDKEVGSIITGPATISKSTLFFGVR
jgi:hypothetical protein